MSANAEIGDHVGQVEATVEGDGTSIAFNAKYLADVLEKVTADQFALELQGRSPRASSSRSATTSTCMS